MSFSPCDEPEKRAFPSVKAPQAWFLRPLRGEKSRQDLSVKKIKHTVPVAVIPQHTGLEEVLLAGGITFSL